MDNVTMESLLLADGDKLRSELRADGVFEKDRARSVQRLRDALGEVLLRYNAAATEDWPRQAMADAMTAVAGEMLALLQAGTVEKDGGKTSVRPGAVISLLLGVICALGAALLVGRSLAAGGVLGALCAVFCFAAGRLWLVRGEIRFQAGLDADAVWRTVSRTGEAMDRKIEGFSARMKEWEAELAAAEKADGARMDPEELRLMGDLLEGLYSDNGEFSLRQLKGLRPYLSRRGVELREYDADSGELFEVLPTKRETRTLRPALLAEGVLLLPGRAAEHTDA